MGPRLWSDGLYYAELRMMILKSERYKTIWISSQAWFDRAIKCSNCKLGSSIWNCYTMLNIDFIVESLDIEEHHFQFCIKVWYFLLPISFMDLLVLAMVFAAWFLILQLPVKKNRLNQVVLMNAVWSGAYCCWRPAQGRNCFRKWKWETSKGIHGERTVGPKWNSCQGSCGVRLLLFSNHSYHWLHDFNPVDGEGSSAAAGFSGKWLAFGWIPKELITSYCSSRIWLPAWSFYSPRSKSCGYNCWHALFVSDILLSG